MLGILGAAGLGGLGVRWTSAAPPFSKWGLQLYTVRSLLTRDVPGTLAAVAQTGYKEVETAGYANMSPADFRKALDAAGLTAPSAHVDINAVDSGIAAQLDNCAKVGHRWLVVPSLPGSFRSADGYKKAGEILSNAAEKAKGVGVRIGYHNHDVDFQPVGNTNGMELILANSSNDVAAELDVYWIVKAGGDPFEFLNKHRGRVKMLHLKDASPAPERAMRSVGAGDIDWARLLPLANKNGVEHVFVEHDNPSDALVSIKDSYAFLSKLK